MFMHKIIKLDLKDGNTIVVMETPCLQTVFKNIMVPNAFLC